MNLLNQLSFDTRGCDRGMLCPEYVREKILTQQNPKMGFAKFKMICYRDYSQDALIKIGFFPSPFCSS